MDRYEVNGFRFNRLFNKLEIVDSKIYCGYVEYRHVTINGRLRWTKRYELVWQYYKKNRRKFGYHIHHHNFTKIDDRPSNLVQLTRKEHTAIHGRVYSEVNHGGSSRMLGKQHSEKTKQQMSSSMTGNNNLPTTRNKKWKERISKTNTRRNAFKSKIMRKIVYMYCRQYLSAQRIADILNVSIQVVWNRLDWFTEDNFKGNRCSELKHLLQDKKLSSFRYYDEEQNIDKEIIRLRYHYLKTPEYICKKLNIEKLQFDNTIERFLVSNKLKDKFNYQIYGLIIEKGLDKLII